MAVYLAAPHADSAGRFESESEASYAGEEVYEGVVLPFIGVFEEWVREVRFQHGVEFVP